MKAIQTLLSTTAILLLLWYGALFAQTPSPITKPTPALYSSNGEEVAALKAQLETMRFYDQRLLATVYWALGGIGAVVLLIIGLGWYTNFRLYKREVVDLKREILASLRPEIDDLVKGVVNSAMRDLKLMQYQMLKLEAEKWEAEGIGANALYAYSRSIEPAMAVSSNVYIPEILDHLLRLLKEGKTAGLHSGIVRALTESLRTIPAEFVTDVDAVQQLIGNARSKLSGASNQTVS